jgi:hypothetical protein
LNVSMPDGIGQGLINFLLWYEQSISVKFWDELVEQERFLLIEFGHFLESVDWATCGITESHSDTSKCGIRTVVYTKGCSFVTVCPKLSEGSTECRHCESETMTVGFIEPSRNRDHIFMSLGRAWHVIRVGRIHENLWCSTESLRMARVLEKE